MVSRHFARQPFLIAFFLLQLVVLFPFRFTSEFGERDSYRMFLGLMDTLKSHAYFDSSLLYNRDASFGYYGLIYALTPLVGGHPVTLIQVMNWISLLSAVSFVIPAYLVTERMFGAKIAAASSLILMATPVWWHCGLYAHPVTPALLLFFSGMAVLCCRSRVEQVSTRVVTLVLFATALMFRLDVLLLFIALAALLWKIREGQPRLIIKEALLYMVGPVSLFALARHFLPQVSRGVGPPSVFDLLARFENISNLLVSLRDAVIALGEGFTALLLIPIPISLWILFRRKQFAGLLFTSGEILINLAFWLPNSVPPRHYLLMAPAISISAAIVVVELLSAHAKTAIGSWQAMAAGASMASAVVALSVALNYGKSYLSYFPSQFTERLSMKAKIEEANGIAEGLVRLPQLNTSVVVLCDSNLVIAEMDKYATDLSATYRVARAGPLLIGVHDVNQGNRRFVMVEQSWEAANVEGFDRSGEYPGLPVLSAPYLPIAYRGRRGVVNFASR